MFKKKKVTEQTCNISSNSKYDEVVAVHHSLLDIQSEEQKIKKYLSSNIFDYVSGNEGIENIFSVEKPLASLTDSLDRHGLNIDRSLPLLKISNLTKFYQNEKLPSLVNLSLKLFSGDFHLLSGVSGSGKTTLLKCIIGSESYEGEIQINNNVSVSEFSNWKSSVGAVPVVPTWDPSKTVQELFVSSFEEAEKSETEALLYLRSTLKQLDISSVRTKPLSALNKLEEKKVSLALALINDPLLVILDEPLVGLQQHEQIELLVHLAKLQQKNRGVLVLSHMLDQFVKFANTITIISEGKVFYSGLIENITTYQKDKYSVVTSDNQLACSLLKNINANYFFNPTINTIYIKFDGKINVLLFQKEIAAKNIVINEFKSLDTSLEDLYSILLKIGTSDAIKKINQTKLFKDI